MKLDNKDEGRVVFFGVILVLLLITLFSVFSIKGSDKKEDLPKQTQEEVEKDDKKVEGDNFDTIISLGLSNTGSSSSDYRYTFTVLNDGEEETILHFPSSVEYNYSIYSTNSNKLVHTSLEKVEVKEEPITKVIKPSETLSYEVDINEVVKSFGDGSYKIQFSSTAKEAEGMLTSMTFVITSKEPLTEGGKNTITLQGVAEDGNSIEGLLQDTGAVNIYYLDASVKSVITKDLEPGTILEVEFEYVGDKRMVTKAKVLKV